jgi:hypothetical protein
MKLKTMFKDLDLWTASFIIAGIVILLLQNADGPNEKAGLSFLDLSPYKIKEDIINHYQSFPAIILSAIGLVAFVSLNSQSKKKITKKFPVYFYSLIIGLLIGYTGFKGTEYLAIKAYMPKLLENQKEVAISSINQIKANGTINAQNLSPEKITATQRKERVNMARDNLIIACDVIEAKCMEHITNDNLIAKIEDQYAKWGLKL